MFSFVVISLTNAKDEYFRMHRASCKDVDKDRSLGVAMTIDADSATLAAREYIAGELDDMGYTVNDIRILPCAYEGRNV